MYKSYIFLYKDTINSITMYEKYIFKIKMYKNYLFLDKYAIKSRSMY